MVYCIAMSEREVARTTTSTTHKQAIMAKSITSHLFNSSRTESLTVLFLHAPAAYLSGITEPGAHPTKSERVLQLAPPSRRAITPPTFPE